MTIAIDGPGAVGKNAIGSLLAKRLGYRFLDTGAMYRALTWQALQLGLDLSDEDALGRLAGETEIDLVPAASDDGRSLVFVNGHNVSSELRGEEVEQGVSLAAKVAGVRNALVAKQRRLAQGGGVVMVGRDIGTVVLDKADLKIYLVASPEERARRRYLEMLQRGKQTSYDQVLADLKRRDEIDSNRALSPLQPAVDAELIDTDGLDVAEVLAKVVGLIEGKQ